MSDNTQRLSRKDLRTAARSLPDEIDILIRQHKEDAETAIPEIAIRTVIGSIPFAGSAINEITSGLAQRRSHERIKDVFEAMKERLDSLGEEKIDPEYFHTEEFQTVLYLLLERLHATHQKEKLRMFGNALGNAGVIEFKADDKEEFVRVLRDLSLNDLKILDDETSRDGSLTLTISFTVRMYFPVCFACRVLDS